MLRATIDDLRLACGGLLRLGDLPPLNGERTLLTGVSHYLSEVLPGMVYWPLDGLGGSENRLAEEAYSHGAIGVVIAERRVVPWAGCWSLQVKDAWQAWIDWQNWSDRHALHWDEGDFHEAPKRFPPIETSRFRRFDRAAASRPHETVAKATIDDSARAAVMRVIEHIELRRERHD
ncbi:MAG: hypothetical protein QM811_27735 [Pirellulales bacterium]